MSKPIVDFYWGSKPDSEGRMLEEILLWDYERLEKQHDYIQWLFPLRQPSRYNMSAPLLDDEQAAAFDNMKDDDVSAILKDHVRESLDMMLEFYGLVMLFQSRIIIQKASNWSERKRNWVTPGNHNFLRLTRILTSLKELGLPVEAAALFKALDDIYAEHSEIIGETTYRFWQEAAG